jgi:outer membrane protein OmpA-like peptidoglycan-associated protein
MGGVVALAAFALWWFAYKQEHYNHWRIALPNGTTVSVWKDSLNDKLAKYLASGSSDVPKTFHFDHLKFRPTADLTTSSEHNLSALATILKAYPDVQVKLVDHSGNPAHLNTKQKFSAPANAVKAELVSAGVNPERISTTGFGSARQLPAYETEQGGAKTRGLDLTVTAR